MDEKKTFSSQLVDMAAVFLDIIGRVGRIDIQAGRHGGLTVEFCDNDKSRTIWFPESIIDVDCDVIRRYAKAFRKYDRLDQNGVLDNFYRAFYIEQVRLVRGKGKLSITLNESSIRVYFERGSLAKSNEFNLAIIELADECLLIHVARVFFICFN